MVKTKTKTKREKETRRERKGKKLKKKRTMEVKKIIEEWEIWNEEEVVVKSEEETKILILERFYKWIYIFGKKLSERILIRKIWDYTIELKKRFVLKKGYISVAEREKRRDI